MKRNATIRHALNFDDVLILPGEGAVKPADVSLRTQLTRDIALNIPFISSPAPHVTESAMAIALGELGGLGVIHRHMPMGKQVEEVRRVKRYRARVVAQPLTITPDASLAEAMDLMATYKVSGLPVIEQPSRRVVGIITRRDIAFVEDPGQPVSTLMTTELVTAKEGISPDDARRLMHQHRIEKLILTDAEDRVAGLLTVKDIERNAAGSRATLDAQGRLRVGAAVGIGKDAVDRAVAMADAGVDIIFVDMAHAHSRDVAGTVSQIRQQRTSEVQVVAGNVATADAARSLIDAGADAIKVGIYNSAARNVGVGMPQLQAVLDVAEECGMQGIPVLVEGGLNTAARCAKALAAGAQGLIVNSLFAGAEEAPGAVSYHDGRLYRSVQQQAPRPAGLFVDPLAPSLGDPDLSAPYTGPVAHMVAGLSSGITTAMAYAGARDLLHFRDNAEFVHATKA